MPAALSEGFGPQDARGGPELPVTLVRGWDASASASICTHVHRPTHLHIVKYNKNNS